MLVPALSDRMRPAAAWLMALLLAACAPGGGAPLPPPAAPAPILLPPAPPPPPESPAAAAARRYYADVQRSLLAQGLLRTDGGGPDAPFTDSTLAENFLTIALFDEYADTPAGKVQRQTPSTLHRWEMPVRVGLRFGASVPPAMRATDTARVASYLARLARLSGHPIALGDSNPNFLIYVVGEDERRRLGPVLQAALPRLSASDLAQVAAMAPSTYCNVLVQPSASKGVYIRAFAVVRAEHPDLLRLSCYHEEIAQGLGLTNDSPTARPSIFNDNEEFALLTTQDELMLRLLYNPALHPGMTEAEARPIVQELATGLLGSGG